MDAARVRAPRQARSRDLHALGAQTCKKGTFAIHLGLLAFLPFTYRAFGSCTCPDPPPRDGGACGPGHLRGTDQQLVAQPATGMAVDPAEAAIALTSENALRCGVKERLSLFHGTAKEFAEAWSGDDFDLIVSNPPYIPSLEIPNLQPDVRDFEDHGALDGGQDGLVVVAEVLQTARAVGEVGARIFLEVHHTHPSVFEALEERAAPSLLAALEGLRLVQTVHDAYGQPRFVVLEVLDKASRVEDSREKKQELTP
ncbi:MTRF1L release factor glutamine methyltransferase (HemK methyltransferase family member 1) (M.HsaHemKP) [Durusdinium trenchii]|uniref:MTRF1L release factor glutamine methyltransferase (HemK methyltransferase family member 1) (M.HsaHemKP) n=1 Tax=Durusdinium trenchii TaxID=1381693 RepID=A0ABP0IDV6_9DINO